ncbi:MAG TPA: SDR family NAD(P)-dependent oxidoreductase [Streptosporangiaceae bacterium]|jgi:hypothetical protein|nr:SDR family NAD(P)-dependent oxidoreductase [Streptosporangiaceae bacterium]
MDYPGRADQGHYTHQIPGLVLAAIGGTESNVSGWETGFVVKARRVASDGMARRKVMNETQNDRRVVVITGGSDGIGAAAARLLARRGDQIVLVGRSPGKTRTVAAELGADGHELTFRSTISRRS